MRFCLIRPPTFVSARTYPYNMECLSTALEHAGAEVSWVDGEQIAASIIARHSPHGVVDSFLSKIDVKSKIRHEAQAVEALCSGPETPLWTSIADAIVQARPDVVGFSCYSASMTSTVLICKALRSKIGPDIPIVLGGPHPSAAPEECLQRIPEADFVICGEGEQTCLELTEALDTNHKPLSAVKGLLFRKNGNIKATDARPLMRDINILPPPSFKRAGPEYSDYVIMTSRGCPFHCHYCASDVVWQRKVRLHSPDHTVAQIVNLTQQSGTNYIRLGDDTFTLSRSHMARTASALQDACTLDIRFSVGSRIDTIDPKKAEILKNMGVERVTFGIESGSQTVLDRICKRIKAEDVVPTIRMLNDMGISTLTFFIINHPAETADDMAKTLDLVKQLTQTCSRNTVSLNTGFPYPGTPWWDYCAERGLTISLDFYRQAYKYNHQSLPSVNMTLESVDTITDFKRQIEKIEFRARARRAGLLLWSNPRALLKKIYS